MFLKIPNSVILCLVVLAVDLSTLAAVAAPTSASQTSTGTDTYRSLSIAVAPFVGITQFSTTGVRSPIDHLSTIGTEIDVSYRIFSNSHWTLAPLITIGYDLGRGETRDGGNSLRLRHRNNVARIGLQLLTRQSLIRAGFPPSRLYSSISYGLAHGVVIATDNSPTYRRMSKGPPRSGTALGLSIGSRLSLGTNVSIDLGLDAKLLQYGSEASGARFEEERIAGFGLSSNDGTVDAKTDSLTLQTDSLTLAVHLGLAYSL